jgi:ribosomal protein L29
MAGKQRQPRAKELREMSETDLKEKAQQLHQELWRFRLKVREGAETHSHQASHLRRQKARIYTVLRERAKAAA